MEVLELLATVTGISDERMTDLSSVPDATLLSRLAQGDEAAFTALYRRRQGGIYRFALQMSGSEAIAEDVTQEVFLLLIRGGSSYDSRRGSVQAFLYGVARNYVLRALDRRPESTIEHETEPSAAGADALANLTRAEMLESVRQAVLALPAHYREVVVLCDLEEMDYADAAEALGCAIGTVRSRLHRARGLLTEKLKSDPARCV
jgi:RNA polymerase sigma-70 factor (ECF subfamily)